MDGDEGIVTVQLDTKADQQNHQQRRGARHVVDEQLAR
jgi:hypothetical protein